MKFKYTDESRDLNEGKAARKGLGKEKDNAQSVAWVQCKNDSYFLGLLIQLFDISLYFLSSACKIKIVNYSFFLKTFKLFLFFLFSCTHLL